MDTIFALSSGSPPAAIAIIRISGVLAGVALRQLAGDLPAPRKISLRTLRDSDGATLDHALILWVPGPETATGEDIAELHLHGGRAVVRAVEQALSSMPGLRRAEAGEFTRRAFINGRMDLAEAEGLADLLSAETELQRRAAIAMAGGSLSAVVGRWRDTLLGLSAQIEAALDFSDEDDVSALPERFLTDVEALSHDLGRWLERPAAEKLREGFRVVLAGPPNAGKSTLFNALLEDEAAIVSDIAGTTRDIIERPVAVEGVPFTFVDTAGLRADGADSIETVGIARAEAQIGFADLVLWLGDEGQGPDGAVEVEAMTDLGHATKAHPDVRVSARTGEGIGTLWQIMLSRARQSMPKPGDCALNQRQRALVDEAHMALQEIGSLEDPLLIGEQLRLARLAFDRLIGRTSTEDMLDALFGRFCIGK